MKMKSSPCSACPFRRNAAPGWLGGNRPEDFVIAATSGRSIGCHMAVDQDLSGARWKKAEAEAPRCYGAFAFMKNSCKLADNPGVAAIVKLMERDPDIFSAPHEFIDHHNAAPFKSWEFRNNRLK